MGLFSTRNHDGASGKGERNDTVSRAEMERIRNAANKHNVDKASLFSPAGVRFRKAHRPEKAGTN